MNESSRLQAPRRDVAAAHADRSQCHRLQTYVVLRGLAEALPLPRVVRRLRHRDAPPPEVVAGIDGLPGGFRAARWGAVEAAARRIPLRLIYAVDPSDRAGAIAADPQRAERVAVAALRTAERQARRAAVGVQTTSEIVHARTAEALVSQSAVVTCIGSNGGRAANPGHRTGIAMELVLTSAAPVTIVRGDPLRAGLVVAQLDLDSSMADVLHHAAEEANLRCSPLRLLANWVIPDEAVPDRHRVHCQLLTSELERLSRRYPWLDVEVVTNESLEAYLAKNAERIALFVAGERQTHNLGTVLTPSVEAAWARLDCPVMIGGG